MIGSTLARLADKTLASCIFNTEEHQHLFPNATAAKFREKRKGGRVEEKRGKEDEVTMEGGRQEKVEQYNVPFITRDEISARRMKKRKN